MNARISPQYLDGLSRQGRMMVDILVLSAQGLITAAEHNTAADGHYERGEFTRLVRQLMAQRQLAEEVLDSEIEYGDYDYELATLRLVLQNLCRESECKVLAVQARLARGAGKEDLAARVESCLPPAARATGIVPAGYHVI